MLQGRLVSKVIKEDIMIEKIIEWSINNKFMVILRLVTTLIKSKVQTDLCHQYHSIRPHFLYNFGFSKNDFGFSEIDFGFDRFENHQNWSGRANSK